MQRAIGLQIGVHSVATCYGFALCATSNLIGLRRMKGFANYVTRVDRSPLRLAAAMRFQVGFCRGSREASVRGKMLI